MATNLYRHFDADGNLLYVGISVNALARLRGGHRRDSEWFSDIATVTVEHFRNRVDAERAERAAIRAERPRYNRVVYKNKPKKKPRGYTGLPGPVPMRWLNVKAPPPPKETRGRPQAVFLSPDQLDRIEPMWRDQLAFDQATVLRRASQITGAKVEKHHLEYRLGNRGDKQRPERFRRDE